MIVEMLVPYEIHRDVGIDEDHRDFRRRPAGAETNGPVPCPRSISASIERTSNPSRHSEPLARCEPLDLETLAVRKQYLESLTHVMSISISNRWVILAVRHAPGL